MSDFYSQLEAMMDTVVTLTELEPSDGRASDSLPEGSTAYHVDVRSKDFPSRSFNVIESSGGHAVRDSAGITRDWVSCE